MKRKQELLIIMIPLKAALVLGQGAPTDILGKQMTREVRHCLGPVTWKEPQLTFLTFPVWVAYLVTAGSEMQQLEIPTSLK